MAEIKINGSEYYFNINKVCDFFDTAGKNDKEKEIVDNYEQDDEGSLQLSTKIIREFSSPNSSQFDNIKYDLLKTFIIQIITYASTEVDIDKMPLGTRLAFNTMVEEGFLVKK